MSDDEDENVPCLNAICEPYHPEDTDAEDTNDADHEIMDISGSEVLFEFNSDI